MELNELRKIFYEDMTNNKKNFVIRIRDNEDFVYYNGIKIFEIKDSKLRISSNIFELSESFLEEHSADFSKEYSQKKLFKSLAQLRLMLFNAGYLKSRKKMVIRYEMSSAKSYKERKEDVLKNKDLILKNVKNNLGELSKVVKLKDSCINKNGNAMDCCSIKNDLKLDINDLEFNNLDKMIKLVNIEYVLLNEFIYFDSPKWSNPIEMLKNKSGWKKPTVLIFDTVAMSIEKMDKDKLYNLIDVMKKAVDEYLKVAFEAEKYYQHQFMTDKKVLKQFKNLGIDRLYRFEEEYYTYNSQDKGRIDSVFVSLDGKDLYLIELKVNRDVIKGTNGIHKHFIDIENLCDPKQGNLSAFTKKIKNCVDYRRKALGQEKIKFEKKMKIHFWTIIAYSDKKEKEFIKKEMLDSYKKENGIIGIKRIVESKNGYTNRVLTLDKHIENLENFDCDVRIYFDAIDYDKKTKKLSLKGNKLETYYINSEN